MTYSDKVGNGCGQDVVARRGASRDGHALSEGVRVRQTLLSTVTGGKMSVDKIQQYKGHEPLSFR